MQARRKIPAGQRFDPLPERLIGRLRKRLAGRADEGFDHFNMHGAPRPALEQLDDLADAHDRLRHIFHANLRHRAHPRGDALGCKIIVALAWIINNINPFSLALAEHVPDELFVIAFSNQRGMNRHEAGLGGRLVHEDADSL